MECRRQVDRDHGVPPLDRKALDRRDVLDAGVVHEDVDASVPRIDVRDHGLDLVGFRQVGAFVVDVDAVFGREFRSQSLDLRRITETVEHETGATTRERLCDTQSDAAGRAGDECKLAFEHGVSLYNRFDCSDKIRTR